MNTDLSWPIYLEITLFWLSYYYESVILVTHTHKAPYHLPKVSKSLVIQNCLVLEKNGFVYLNEKWTLTYPGQLDWKFLTFCLSYYYESGVEALNRNGEGISWNSIFPVSKLFYHHIIFLHFIKDLIYFIRLLVINNIYPISFIILFFNVIYIYFGTQCSQFQTFYIIS